MKCRSYMYEIFCSDHYMKIHLVAKIVNTIVFAINLIINIRDTNGVNAYL